MSVMATTDPCPHTRDGAIDVTGDLQYELTLLSRHYLHTRQVRPHHTLEMSAYVLLSRLELEAPMSLKQLATAFRLDASTINRQVRALVRKRFVDYVVDPDGGPARKVRPTASGLEALESDRHRSSSGLERVMEHWSDDDRRRLCELLMRFNQDIERLEGMPWPRPTR